MDYFSTCGEIGKRMADEVLIRVSLRLEAGYKKDKEKTGADKMDVQEEGTDLVGLVKELNETCFQYRREPVRRMICRVCIGPLFLQLPVLIASNNRSQHKS